MSYRADIMLEMVRRQSRKLSEISKENTSEKSEKEVYNTQENNDNEQILSIETSFADGSAALNVGLLNEQQKTVTGDNLNVEQDMLYFDSDDSLLDPDYEISELCSDESDDILNQVGKQIENNLNRPSTSTTVNTSSKKRRNYNSRNEIKKKRNKGEAYVNRKGVTVPERKFVPLNRDCRKQCKQKITNTAQKQIFDQYWALGTYNQRILFIGGLIEIEEKKSETLRKHKIRNRQHNMKYYLNFESDKINVCQKCFRQCFNETESFLKSVVKKKLNQPYIDFSDRRGISTPPTKLIDSDIEKIRQHINCFPAYESHYSRRDSSCRYLHSDLTLSSMHRLYCENSEAKSVSLKTYSDIFKTMNIKFKKPKVDTCTKCDIVKTKIDIAKDDPVLLENLKKEQTLHHIDAELAYKSKDEDKSLSKADVTVKTCTFDLQQCLPTPYLQSSVSFYKRQLWTFNLTVHDCETNKPYCFMWHEGLAKRGGNEIASCLLKHLQLLEQENGHVKSVIYYSDNCAGQNKNSYLSTMFMAFLHNSNVIQTIDHKFLVVGHTHMECDVDHALIERKKKHTTAKIHHPHDWFNFVRTVGVNTKFEVIQMGSADFMDFSSFSKSRYVWRNRDTNSGIFNWRDVKWLRYSKGDLGEIQFKTSLDKNEPFKILNIRKIGIISGGIMEISKLPEQNKISAKKKKDLMDMLPMIYPCFHAFYENLTTADIQDVHPDLVEPESNESPNY